MAKQTEDSNRMAELEAQLDQLKTELAALRPAPKPALQYVEPEGTRIIQEPPPFIRPDDFPTKSQLASLLRNVFSAYPRLEPAAGVSDTYMESFEKSFLALCHIRRSPEIKHKYMSDWRDYGQEILAGLSSWAKLDLGAFCCAVIAHGDVLYSHPNHPQNFSMSAGLIHGGGTAGKAYSGAWKKVFEAGRVNPPVEISAPRNVMSHDVRIIGGNHVVGQRF